MNQFFSTLKQMGIDRYALSILFDGDMVSVSVLPKSSAKDTALLSLRPLSLRGKVDEVDEQFFRIIQKPMEQTKALFRNTVAFEETLEQTAKNTQQAKKKKESTSKKAKELRELLKAKDFNPMQDHKKATDIANEILKMDPDHKEAKKALADMKAYESPKLFQ